MTLVAPRRLSAADIAALPLPLQLNTHQIAGEGPGNRDTLGTLTFTPAFLACLEQALRAELWEDHLKPHEWHRSPYVVGKLAVVFGVPIIRAVLAYLRAVRDLEDDETFQAMDDWRAYRPYREDRLNAAVAPHGMTVRQVERAERQITWLCEGKLMGHRPKLFYRPDRERQSA